MDVYLERCERLVHSIRLVRARIDNSTLPLKLDELQHSVEDLRTCLSNFDSDQASFGTELMRRVLHMESMADQQMTYWMVMLNESMVDYRRSFLRDNDSESRIENPRAVVNQCIENGHLIPHNYFDKYIRCELENLREG